MIANSIDRREVVFAEFDIFLVSALSDLVMSFHDRNENMRTSPNKMNRSAIIVIQKETADIMTKGESSSAN